ncbi:hypothetical protein SAMN05444285_104136 [Draconibacterium orientale]|jgi:hypothetical protein|uniref:Uncharacterized protein n=1 Tax=Draconibacterium orientale TaxID=1168034 RepID=A0A1I0B0K6_9BACT|nr:hypothetical protein SAMN05444285_104136 [Draconibacterium orientale]
MTNWLPEKADHNSKANFYYICLFYHFKQRANQYARSF